MVPEPVNPQMVHPIEVAPSYRMFTLLDPTCDDLANLDQAGDEAMATRRVGWGANAVAVTTVLDHVRTSAALEVWPSAPDPPTDELADLVEQSTIEVPGGSLAVAEAVAEADRLGVELPAGGGTYGVRVIGTGRRRVKELFERPGSEPDELRGVESYRIQVWQVSSTPRWDDDEDH